MKLMIIVLCIAIACIVETSARPQCSGNDRNDCPNYCHWCTHINHKGPDYQYCSSNRLGKSSLYICMGNGNRHVGCNEYSVSECPPNDCFICPDNTNGGVEYCADSSFVKCRKPGLKRKLK